jgi:ribose transport system substrate-binding protein
MTTRRHTLPTAATATFAALLLAACSPGTADDSSSSSGSSGGADSPVADVQADVEEAMQPRDSFEVPGEPVDPSALSGKTVYYIR